MHVLVTRPREDAAPLLDELTARGHTADLEPLLHIHNRRDAAVDLTGVQALLFTSANGVRALAAASERRDLPAFAVGEASAAAAREAGFTQVESADGDANDLARLVMDRLAPEHGILFHAAGTVTAGGLKESLGAADFQVRRMPLYDAVPAESLSETARAALATGRYDAILFFSPRTADTFVSLVRRAELTAACGRTTAVCLSANVAAKAGALPWRDIRTADRPERPALLAALDALDAAGHDGPTAGQNAPDHADAPTEADVKIKMQQDPNDQANRDTDGKSDSQGESPHPESPAQKVIASFGGIRPMAHKLGVAVSTVQGWKARNAIPETRHADIQEAARAHGIDLDPDLLHASGDGRGEHAETTPAAEPPETVDATETTGTSEAEAAPERRDKGEIEDAEVTEGPAAERETSQVEAMPEPEAPETAGDGGRERPGAGAAMPPPPPPRPTGWVPGMLLGAAVLAIGAGGAIVLRDHWMPFIDESFQRPAVSAPSQDRLDALEQRLAALRDVRTTARDLGQQVAALEDRLAEVESAVDSRAALEERLSQVESAVESGAAAGGDGGGVAAARVEALETRQTKLQETLDTLQARIGRVDEQAGQAAQASEQAQQASQQAGAAEQQAAQLESRLAELSSRVEALAGKAATGNQVQDLRQQLGQIESRVSELAAKPADEDRIRSVANETAGRQVARALAVQDIAAAVDKGRPFADSLAAARQAVAGDSEAAQALDTLAPHAEGGVPTQAALADRFPKKAGEAIAVSAAGEGQGDLVSGVLQRLGDVVSVRRVGADAEGSGTDAVLARAEARLQNGDLAGAVEQVASLQGRPAEVMKPWLDDARARLSAETAVRTLNARLMQNLAKADGNGS